MTVTFRLNTAGVNRLSDIAMDALEEAGIYLAAEANRTIPYDTGAMLRSSAVTRFDNDHTVTVSYDTPYAVYQHEDRRPPLPPYRHQGFGRSFWLERTAEEKRTEIGNKLAAEIGSHIGGVR